jgi:hypothetical protein
MKRRLFQMLLGAACFMLVMAMFEDLNGKWTGVINTPDGQALNATYDFKVVGETLTGTAESEAGVLDIENGKVAGDDFTFSVTVDGTGYPHTGKVYKDSCGLDIDFGGTKVHTTLMRAPK